MERLCCLLLAVFTAYHFRKMSNYFASYLQNAQGKQHVFLFLKLKSSNSSQTQAPGEQRRKRELCPGWAGRSLRLLGWVAGYRERACFPQGAGGSPVGRPRAVYLFSHRLQDGTPPHPQKTTLSPSFLYLQSKQRTLSSRIKANSFHSVEK